MKSFSRHSIFALSAAMLMAIVLVFPLKAEAQAHYSFRHANYNVGLSSANVKSIVEDSYGFVWLGTKNGLHRYDGTATRRHKCYDYTKNAGNDNIDALYEDRRHRLWVGTDRGVYIYDPVTDRFALQDQRDKATGEYPNNWVQTICGDSRGDVWVLLPDLGVFRYHGSEVYYHSVVPRRGGFKEMFPSDMCADASGNVWVITTVSGLYRYNRRTSRFDRVAPEGGSLLDGLHMAVAVEDVDGTIVLSSTDGHMFRYTPSSNRLAPIAFSGTGRVYMRCIQCFDSEMWMGTQHGLYVIDRQSGAETLLHADALNSFSLSDDIVTCLYRGRSGDAWVGTLYGGADYMTRKKFGFRSYGLWSGLTGRVVDGLAQASDNTVWIGTEDKGLFTLNPATQQIHAVTNPAVPYKTSLMLAAYNGAIYAGFSRGGLLRMGAGGTATPVISVAESDNSVYSYLMDSHGNEWVGLGYACYRRAAGTTRFVRVNETGYAWIFSLFEGHDGTVWIATMGNGLWRYTPATGRYKSYTSGDNSTSGLRSNSISAFMEDSRGRIWVSTDRGGISRYDKAQDRFVTYGIAEGLPDDVAYNMLEDKKGNLWFGTNKGLVKFNPDTRAVKVFTDKDGLPGNQFNYNSALRANDGMFYFGGIGGVVAFDPELEDACSPQLSIYFTRLRVCNEEITTSTPGSPLARNIMFTDRLTLPYDKATLSLDMVSPGFGVGDNGIYSYRLSPGTGEWTRLTEPHILFANLQPGTYRLTVRVENHGQTAQKELTIVITPPWWLSAWAYAVYLLLVVAAVGVWFRWYRAHKEKQLHERQRLFAVSKEKELYQNKVNFFTEVAHEIRTPLTLIDAPLEAIEEIGTNDKTVAHYLKVMRQNTRRLLNLTGQLLDFQKLGANSLTLKYENVDIAALVSETADRFEPTITLRGKTLARTIDGGEPLVASVDREAVTKILSNLMNNALKYARRAIAVSLSHDAATFSVSVTSDGEKIKDADRKRIFEAFYQVDKSVNGENGVGIGLPLSLSLARLLGGTLTLDDATADGNTFTLTLPLNKEGIRQNNRQTLSTPDYLLDDDSNQSRSGGDGCTVLIVEDNDNMREFLAEQVSAAFTVETAANGREALAKLKASRIDIIVTDVMMPEMDGFALCRAVKSDIDLSHIPVVFITAKNDLDSKISGLKLGAEAYIEKPFSIKYFRQLIRSLLDNRRRERESFAKKPFYTVDNMHMPKADEEFMQRVTKIIEEHVGEDNFNVESMAALLCMSHSSLLRKIKLVFNMSPIELIRTVKMKKAAELIKEGKYLIGDICYMVGISSPSYFSKIFFAQFGISPKDFERQNRERK